MDDEPEFVMTVREFSALFGYAVVLFALAAGIRGRLPGVKLGTALQYASVKLDGAARRASAS